MSSWESDVIPQAGGKRAPQPTFATVRRGYDPNQVLEYLSGVADHVEALESQVRKLDSDLQQARRHPPAARSPASQDPYEAVSTRVADLVRTFDQDVERLRAEAEAEVQRLRAETQAEVQRLLAEARADADRMRVDAQANAEETRAEAERALREAKSHADQALSGLAARREALIENLRGMHERMVGTTGELAATIKQAASAPDQVVVEEDSKATRRP